MMQFVAENGERYRQQALAGTAGTTGRQMVIRTRFALLLVFTAAAIVFRALIGRTAHILS